MIYRSLFHVHKILTIKISKKMLTKQKFKKTLQLQTLIPPKKVKAWHNEQYDFLKVRNETFQTHLC